MNDQPPALYRIGDFAGFSEYVGSFVKRAASEKQWHLVSVSDGLSGSDVELLRRVHVDLYRPLMRSMRLVPKKLLSRSRPLREKIEPFFPGYAFLTFPDRDERWSEVFKMTGIRGLICANHQPVAVPWRMIEEIQSREVDGAVPSSIKLAELPFILGEYVRVAAGPFASFGGQITALPKDVTETDLGNLTLDELDESFKVHLLVDIFGRKTPVALPLADIEKM
jgi:transcription antitermination factor NusG